MYDPAERTVTLAPRHLLGLHLFYRLTVNGTSPGGVAGTDGASLERAQTGAGSNFVAVVHGFGATAIKSTRLFPAGPLAAGAALHAPAASA